MTRVLITGASSGIGRAVALEYAAPGASIVLLGRDAARLDAVAQECRAKGAEAETDVADVRDREDMKRIIEAADARAPLDLVIANAGITSALSTGLMMEDPDSVRGVLAINLIGVFNTIEPAIPLMGARRSGQLAMVGSMAGVRGLPYCPSYCATKAALASWAESIRGVLTPYGVNVALIAPGFVQTPMLEKAKSWQPGVMTDTRAAQIIKSGLDRRKAVIAFPGYVYYALRFFTFLPPRLVDAVMRRFPVEAPQTHERDTV
jgi:short-subunit dehydrogenase